MKFAKLAVACMAVFMVPAYAADLTVEIKGLTSANGKVLISLYDKADGWMKRGLKTGGTAAQKEGVTYEFKDLPLGEYAISIHHDENHKAQSACRPDWYQICRYRFHRGEWRLRSHPWADL